MHTFSHNYRKRWNIFTIRSKRDKSEKEIQKNILINLKNEIYDQKEILDGYLNTIEIQNKEIIDLENRLIKLKGNSL